MGCTSGCFKCFLNILNTLYALLGILILVLATAYLNQAPTVFTTYLFVVGGVLLVSTIIGCCGVCQESVCMTVTYGVILLALLALQLFGLFGKSFDEDYIKKFAIKDVDSTWNLEVIQPGAMDKIQNTYKCCGRDGPDDYVSIGRPTLPVTCYPEKNTTVPFYTTGCVTAAVDEFLVFYNYANNGKWGSFAVTALLCFCAFYLARRFSKDRHTHSYHY